MTDDEQDRLVRAFMAPGDDCAHNMVPVFREVERIIADAEQRGALRALRALDQDMRDERQRDPSTYNVWSRVRGVVDGALAAVPTQAPE